MNAHLVHLAMIAHRHIVMAHVLEPICSAAAFKREQLAWAKAYRVGLRSDEADVMPDFFAQSRTLTFAWEKAREDRAFCAPTRDE